MNEVIEGEVIDVTPAERELIVAPQAHVLSGVGAVASIDDDTFARNLALIRKGVERARQMQTALLDEGTDYGSAGNVTRPFLHKPGAEKLEKAYGLATEFSIERLTGDGVNSAPVSFLARAYVHLGDHSGPIVGEGVGEANSWETKYRYRNAERVCPDCGAAAIKRGTKRGTEEAEYYCWRKKDGCGNTFDINDPRLAPVEKVDNPDPWDLANTLVKMAKKRAYVDGILTATGTSGLFTQDEDSPNVARPNGRSSSPVGAPAPDEPVMVARGWEVHSGKVAKGDSDWNDLEAHASPDGFRVGFRLALADGKALPQVICDGAIGIAMAAMDDLKGQTVTVQGEAFSVEQRGRRPYRRLIVEKIEGDGWVIPAPAAAPEASTGLVEDLSDLPW